MTNKLRIAIIGTVGIPGRYGGFETLAENLVIYHNKIGINADIAVWCSGAQTPKKIDKFLQAKLYYINLKANGVYSVLYDFLSIVNAVRLGYNRILILGVSGACMLPIFRLFTNAKFISNIDGIEWKRTKWGRLSSLFLRMSEWAAVKFSHEVISDNEAIAEYVSYQYNYDSRVIAYGGDQALTHSDKMSICDNLPKTFCLGLCRIEPENNVHLVLEAFINSKKNIVFVGNWTGSAYGENLRLKFAKYPNIFLLDPEYEPDKLYTLRSRAEVYLHGHSAGGTNPSLVEMMHFGVPVLAFDCRFNRMTTENRALYFKTAEDIRCTLEDSDNCIVVKSAEEMKRIANSRYTWEIIGEQYFKLLD